MPTAWERSLPPPGRRRHWVTWTSLAMEAPLDRSVYFVRTVSISPLYDLSSDGQT